MSFLDMMTNFLGAVIVLFLLAAQNPPPKNIDYCSVTATFDPRSKLLFDTLSNPLYPVNGLKIGDTILVVIRHLDTLKLPKMSVTVVAENESTERRAAEVDRPKSYTLPPATPSVPLGKCSISAAYAENIRRDENRTPLNCSDDTYTFDVRALHSGDCNSIGWKDNQGFVRQYNAAIHYGPFPCNKGNVKITLTDIANPSLSTTVEGVVPKCLAPDLTIESTSNAGEALAGPIVFNLSWDDPFDNVDIFVKKDGRWVYGGHQTEASIGTWTDKRVKVGLLYRPRTSTESVVQFEKSIPGTYHVYGFFKKSKSGRKNIKCTLGALSKKVYASSKTSEHILSLDTKSPREGGGKLLGEFTILADGSIQKK